MCDASRLRDASHFLQVPEFRYVNESNLDYARIYSRTCKTLSGFSDFFILTQGTFHLTLGCVVKPLCGK